MEPLFENRLTLDKPVLLEWYKKEFRSQSRLFALVSFGAALLYLLIAVILLLSARLLGQVWPYVVAAVFVVLAVLFVVNYLMRHHLQVALLLRRDKSYPKESVTLFYPAACVPMEGEELQNPAGQIADSLQAATEIKTQLETLVLASRQADMSDPLRLAGLRAELGELQGRMDAAVQVLGRLGEDSPCAYQKLTEVLETQNLYILHYGELVVLVSKTGFAKGDEADFARFIREKLPKAKNGQKPETGGEA